VPRHEREFSGILAPRMIRMLLKARLYSSFLNGERSYFILDQLFNCEQFRNMPRL
jgi:hypothetical protein